MRTEREQEDMIGYEARRIAAAIRVIEAEAKSLGMSTLAYLLDMAALEAESASRR